MPKQVTITVYTYDELSDEAKERARDWWRTGAHDDFWSESVIEDAKECGALLGIKIENVYWSGFSSQGDGACFEGSWSAADCQPDKLIEHAPKDDWLHRLADRFHEFIQDWPQASFRVTHAGHYCHEHSTNFEVQLMEDEIALEAYLKLRDLSYDSSDKEICGIARDFMRWIYGQLEREYDYINSDEQVAESIRINEYTFTADGERY